MTFKQFRKYGAPLAALPALVATSLPAQAAIDVTPVVSEINSTTGPIGLIGAAVLVVVVSIAAFRWVRRAISG